VIPESNIIETINSMGEKQYDINNLQLSIGDYTFVSQFTVKSLFCDDSDIIETKDFELNFRSKCLHTKVKVTKESVLLLRKKEGRFREPWNPWAM
jgi:hypothetical protein